MKKVKKYFDMILTAVICFFMGLVPGKKGTGNVTKVLTGGQGVLQNGRGGNGNSVLLHGWGVPEMEQKKAFSVMSEVSDHVTENSESGKNMSSSHFGKRKKLFRMRGPGDTAAAGESPP